MSRREKSKIIDLGELSNWERGKEPKESVVVPFAEARTKDTKNTNEISNEIDLHLDPVVIDPQIASLKPQVESISHQRNLPNAEQTEVLKRYIHLKETEVRDLREQYKQLEQMFKKTSVELMDQSTQLQNVLSEMDLTKRREEILRIEIREIKERYNNEIEKIKNEYEDRLKKSHYVKGEFQELESKREEWQNKVKEDLKRIRLKERELENRYELLKRDTQALLDSKDKHVLELKKKNDALELEMEALEERLRGVNTVLGGLDVRKNKLVETLKLALTLLENIETNGTKKDGE